MSKIRRMKGTYSHTQKRGPEGERLCYWCEKVVQPPKRSFCSQDCVHEWRLRTSPSYIRECLRKRDKEVCAICKMDCKALKTKLKDMRLNNPEEWQAELVKLAIPKNRFSLWDADHITPVCEGGGESGLDNFRTLCLWCHKAETKALRARLAKARPASKRRSSKRDKTN